MIEKEKVLEAIKEVDIISFVRDAYGRTKPLLDLIKTAYLEQAKEIEVEKQVSTILAIKVQAFVGVYGMKTIDEILIIARGQIKEQE